MPSPRPPVQRIPRPALGVLAALLTVQLALLPAVASADRPQPNRDRSGQRQRSASKPQLDAAPTGSERASRSGGIGAANEKAVGLEGLDKSGGRQLSAAQEANLQQLKADLGAIGKGMKSAEDEIRTLAQDLQGMALQTPDPALVNALATDLAAAMADATLSPQETAQLSSSLAAVLNSAGLSQGEIAILIDDVEAILTASGVGRAEAQAVVRDLQAIAGTAQGSEAAGSRSFRRSRSGG